MDVISEAQEVCKKGVIALVVDVKRGMVFGHVNNVVEKTKPQPGYRRLSTGKEVRYTPIRELVGR